jgi:hypothetical protein
MIYFGSFLDTVPKTEVKKYSKDLNIDKDELENLLEINCQYLGTCSFNTTKFKVANLLLSAQYQ